jgi:histidinol-phosphate aminotransferase
MIQPVSHVSRLSPYALAELSDLEGRRLISLAQNESLTPPSPLAVSAAAGAMEAGHLYPDPDWRDLRSALAALHDLPAEWILCGNGSMELISCLTQAYADENCSVLAPAHAYPFFKTAAQVARARFDTAPEKSRGVCVDTLIDHVQPDTRIVFVANPGNPTGTVIPKADLVRLREALPDQVLLVVDEAYGEYADHLNEPVFDLVERGDTVVLRTFSKAYGLAGMRIGWGVFPLDIATQTRKIMNPNNISVAAQAAAIGALNDQDYMKATRSATIQLRDDFATRLRRAGFEIPESFTNFVLIRFANPQAARSADAALRADGIMARGQAGAGLPECLRITMGQPAEMDRTAQLLEAWIEGDTP